MPGQLKAALICLSLLFALVLGPRAALEAQGTAGQPSSGSGEVKLKDGSRLPVHYESPKIYKGEKISIDFKNEEIRNIIKAIEKVSGKKIVIPDNVSGRVTIKLRDVPWDQALDIVLAARNLGVEESGETLTVYELPSLNQLRSVRCVRLPANDNAQPVQANPLDKKVFTPKYTPIGHVAAELGKLKSERGRIVSIGNDIYVEDKPEAMAAMSQAFIDIDRVAPQILIEARIVAADAAFQENLGASWKSGGAAPEPAGPEAGEKMSRATLAYDFLSPDKASSLEAAISSAEARGGVQTITAPRFIAANDQEVDIKQGRGTGCGYGRSSSSTAAKVQFKEFVAGLLVTPHVEEDGQNLTLDLTLYNDTLDSSQPDSAEPALITREATTRLQLEGGRTIVIGGICTEGRSAGGRSESISDWLFKDHPNIKAEMLIFLTATIVPAKI